MTVVRVGGAAAYDVTIGRGTARTLPDVVAATAPHARAAVVVHPVDRPADATIEALRAAGIDATGLRVPAGEAAKDITVLQHIWAVCGERQLTRTDILVGVGGGATTDVTGFAAATWLRGVGVIHLPTTVLGMVDAAVGGKTGINTAAGKNLVGAFHAPLAVVCDLDLLDTLPAAEIASGMAEIVKCGFIADPAILDIVEPDPARLVRADAPQLDELVWRAVQVKADVVTADFRESGRREILNYGHTLGHAIEKVEGFRWRHGEAIAVGMCFAARLSVASGRLADAAQVARHDALFEALGLPTRYTRSAWPQLLDAMRVDKKTRAGRLRFVVLDGVGSAGVLEDVDEGLLTELYAEVCA
ncbi:MAG: 3-dehydroquinate synthase [Frankiaceae bacterium]|nr:3-dehydroquinate synthase [Frankiaceae bacterium]